MKRRVDRPRATGRISEVLNLTVRGRCNLGYCPVCRKPTLFLKRRDWLRDFYICPWCRSIPRQRALMEVLRQCFPNWRDLDIYESSPDGALSRHLQRQCRGYIASQYWPDAAPGSSRDGVRCEDLEALTFETESFDLVVTQDVFEHVLDPDAAFREVARVLAAGGAHVFTVPLYTDRKTSVRARRRESGIEYLAEPAYHHNPVDPNGSLVVTDWGLDTVECIRRASGMHTELYRLRDPRRGIDGEFLDVLVSRKPARILHQGGRDGSINTAS